MRKTLVWALFGALAVSVVAAFAPPKETVTRPVSTTRCYSTIQPASRLLVAAGTAIGASLGSLLLRNHGTKAMLDKIDAAFPGSLTNAELVDRVYEKLSKQGYDKSNTLLCTSLSRDEITNNLEKALCKVYNKNGPAYHMGGLAGFPWGGISAFTSMASQIPPNGVALLVFAPQVGVDETGHLGTLPRRGREAGTAGPCCEAAVAAYKHVMGDATTPQSPTTQDPEYAMLCNALLPYAERLDQSPDPMADLPYSLFDAQKEIMADIVQQGGAAIPADGKVAVLGGIQINTPLRNTDYFIPLSFEIYNNKGEKVDELTL